MIAEEASCLDNIGVYYKERANATIDDLTLRRKYLKLALKFNQQAYRIKKRFSTPRRIALTEHNIGEAYHLLGRNHDALRWLKSSLSIFQKEGLNPYCKDVERIIKKVEAGLGD